MNSIRVEHRLLFNYKWWRRDVWVNTKNIFVKRSYIDGKWMEGEKGERPCRMNSIAIKTFKISLTTIILLNDDILTRIGDILSHSCHVCRYLKALFETLRPVKVFECLLPVLTSIASTTAIVYLWSIIVLACLWLKICIKCFVFLYIIALSLMQFTIF